MDMSEADAVQNGQRICKREARNVPSKPRHAFELQGKVQGRMRTVGFVRVENGCPIEANPAMIATWWLLKREYTPWLRPHVGENPDERCAPMPREKFERLEEALEGMFDCPYEAAYWLVPFLDVLEQARSKWCAVESERKATEAPDFELIPLLAKEVLARTGLELESCPVVVSVPPWLSENLTALFIAKYSFSRGGGTTLSRERIRKLLGSPQMLLAWLRKNPRNAERFRAELTLLEQSITGEGTNAESEAL